MAPVPQHAVNPVESRTLDETVLQPGEPQLLVELRAMSIRSALLWWATVFGSPYLTRRAADDGILSYAYQSRRVVGFECEFPADLAEKGGKNDQQWWHARSFGGGE
jgi:hypothetical protein